ncbi:hypothetical protein Ddye_003295 [Dipteronia dyeriana]|uniref:Transcription factor TFIIIC triple barrel domain-containing protein n=1 Tax=Dipteronia dyeriana TaxID=168575 RepID=A0AAE0CV86_9ROSI|nr:hypothetical protein Ddye_003295 [Dipteronia dyeriana]
MSIYEVLPNWAGSNGPSSYPHDVIRVYTRPFHYQTRSSYHISALSVSSLSPLSTHHVFCFQLLPAKLLTIRCARIQPLNPTQGLAFNKWSQLTTHNSYVWELRDSYLVLIVMEANKMHPELEEDEEDFVLLNLDVLCRQFDIPPNVPYTLTDLDTLNPILIIDRKFKLIGEYEETIGTCFGFSKDEAAQMVPDERGPLEANLTPGKKHNTSKLSSKKASELGAFIRL